MGFIYQEANAYGVEALVALERHYTPTEEKYCTAVTEAVRICDTYGILLVCECNIETHGLMGALTHDPAWAAAMFERFVRHVDEACHGSVSSGIFGAEMEVRLCNWGPVTIWLDSTRLFS